MTHSGTGSSNPAMTAQQRLNARMQKYEQARSLQERLMAMSCGPRANIRDTV